MNEKCMELIFKAQNGDKKALGKIVEENQGLVWSIVKRFNRKRI